MSVCWDVQRLQNGDMSCLRMCFLRKLPKYPPYQFLSVCVIYAFVIQVPSHIKLEQCKCIAKTETFTNL